MAIFNNFLKSRNLRVSDLNKRVIFEFKAYLASKDRNRHGFATYPAEEGASPAAIQILLGHESLNTTTRYVNASDRFAQETHRKYHPLAEKVK